MTPCGRHGSGSMRQRAHSLKGKQEALNSQRPSPVTACKATLVNHSEQHYPSGTKYSNTRSYGGYLPFRPLQIAASHPIPSKLNVAVWLILANEMWAGDTLVHRRSNSPEHNGLQTCRCCLPPQRPPPPPPPPLLLLLLVVGDGVQGGGYSISLCPWVAVVDRAHYMTYDWHLTEMRN